VKHIRRNNKICLDQLTPSWMFHAVLAIGAFLRLVALKSDPPIDLALGQSLWTDPSQYVFFARNLINFGRMESFIPSGLIFFKYSFISFLSVPIFYIFGSGYWQSNFVSSIISIATIIIFGLTIKKSIGNFAGFIAAIFVGTSYVFVMHNRVPYLENASLFLLSISALIFILKYENRYYLALGGFFLACSLLIGKTLAVMIIPAFVIAILFLEFHEKHLFKRCLTSIFWFLGGFLVFTIIAMAILYLPNYLVSREYLAENVINYYGFPNGLKSLSGFIQGVYTFDLVDFKNRFFDRMPIITICMGLYLYTISLKNRGIKGKRAIILFTSWFICSYLFLSPWNYRPIRYEMYLVLPMAALAALFLYDIASGDFEFNFRRIAPGIIMMSMISFHLYFNLARAEQGGYIPFWRIFGYSILIGILISAISIPILKSISRLKQGFRIGAVFLIVALSIMLDARQFIDWSHKLTYSIDYANRSLKGELNDNAVLMGPYAQTLVLGTNKKAQIFYFGAYPKDDSLFAKVPATHVVYEMGLGGGVSGNQAKFAEYYPEANARSRQIDAYLIGRYYVGLFSVIDGTENSLAKRYKMSDFEKGMYYYSRNMLESAIVYLNKADKNKYMTRAALYKGEIYYKLGNYGKAKLEFARGLKDDCYDPKFWALYSITCAQIGDDSSAKKARERAIKYAPYPGFFNNLIF
jgi:hypothetical protein